jgi:hypothetical protein
MSVMCISLISRELSFGWIENGLGEITPPGVSVRAFPERVNHSEKTQVDVGSTIP